MRSCAHWVVRAFRRPNGQWWWSQWQWSQGVASMNFSSFPSGRAFFCRGGCWLYYNIKFLVNSQGIANIALSSCCEQGLNLREGLPLDFEPNALTTTPSQPLVVAMVEQGWNLTKDGRQVLNLTLLCIGLVEWQKRVVETLARVCHCRLKSL